MILPAHGVLHRAPPAGRVSAQGLRLLLFVDTRIATATGLLATLDRLAFELRVRGGDVRVATIAELGLLLAGRRARALVRASDPTIVHVATPIAAGLAGRAAARALGVPLVTSVLPTELPATPAPASGMLTRLGTQFGWAYRLWFHGAARVALCPTTAVALELRRRGVLAARSWSGGVDRGVFRPGARSSALRARVGAAPDDLVVAYVETSCDSDLTLILDAFALARASVGPRLRLAIATVRPMAAWSRGRMPPGVVHLGALDVGARAALLASADLALHDTDDAAIGRSLLESMAAGVAIMATDGDVPRALLECPGDGPPRGAVVRRHPATIATRLAALAGDLAAREMFVRRGLAYAAGRDWADVVDRLLESYAIARGEPVLELPIALAPAAVVRPDRGGSAPPTAPPLR